MEGVGKWWTSAVVSLMLVRVLAAFVNGVVRPNDPYIYIGENLTMTCNLTKYDEVYDSKYLLFSRKNDEVIPTKFITIESTRSIVMRLPITSPSDGGNYVCKLNRTMDRPVIIGVQYVIVEYEPRPVTEISCRVYNWENMTCTWDLGVQFVHPRTMDVRLVWTASGSQYDCPHQTDTSCSWWADDGENSYLTDVVYFMGVIIENKATKPKSTFYPEKSKVIRIDTSEIVEPAPVRQLTSEKNSTCVTLSWSHQKPHRPKVFMVNFKASAEQHWEIKNIEEEETLTLCGLHPHTAYDFQVSCKPKLFRGRVEGFWSQPAKVSVKTEEDIPTKAPELSPGSFRESPCQHYCKKLMLFWKLLNLEDANGNITYYSIEFKVHNANTEWETTRVKGETQHMLMLIAAESYDIQIRAATSKGLSKAVSRIYVAAAGERPDIPAHVVEAYNATQETMVHISWEPAKTAATKPWKNLTSYTVYWCRGSKMEKLCLEPIKSEEVLLSETSFNVHVDNFDSYLFGVAVNAMLSSGEIISSGFEWNTCSYIKNANPDASPSNIRVSLYQPNSGICVEWDKLSCEDTRAYVKSYLVNICLSDKGNNCSGETFTYTADRDKNSFAIYDLVDRGRYKLWINAQSEAGLGPSSDVLYSVVIDKRLTAGEIVGIVIAALFVLILFLFGMILCFRRIFRTVKQRYFEPVPIEIPNTLPPLPPIPMPAPCKTPESDSSDGIYSKILDGPPSPGSSSESTTGVEAPLINHRLKLSTLKNHIYGHRKSSPKHSSDSGRGSVSQSADTLLLRLHPSHLKKHKKNKKSNQSESDSGVMIDGRGQVCIYRNNDQSNVRGVKHCDIYNFKGGVIKANVSDVNPYSCVDILEKMDSKSEHYAANLSQNDIKNRSKCNGSTLSLPPGLCKFSTFMSPPLDFRAQSAGNELDFDHRRLSSMKEAGEFQSSDFYSEDGTLDSVDNLEHETSASVSQDAVDSDRSGPDKISGMNSYIKFTYKQKMEPYLDNPDSEFSGLLKNCGCECHKSGKGPVMVGDGYVTEAACVGHSEEHCECKQNQTFYSEQDEAQKPFLHDYGKNGIRPCSQVYNLPPLFFGSMSKILMDPSRTTEL